MSLVFRFSGLTALDGEAAAPTGLPAGVMVTRQAGGNYAVTGPAGAAILTLGKIDLNVLVNLAAGRNPDDVLVLQAAAIDTNGIPLAIDYNVGIDFGAAEPSPALITWRVTGPPAAVSVFTQTLQVFTSQVLLVRGGTDPGPFALSIVCLPYQVIPDKLATGFPPA